MTARGIQPALMAVLLVGVFVGALGAEFQCPAATEARPSLEGLQAQIDEIREAARTLRVFDGDGTDLGLHVNGIHGHLSVFLESIGGTVLLRRNGDLDPEESQPHYFSQPDCSGLPYVGETFAARLSSVEIDGVIRHFVGTTAPVEWVTASSIELNHLCSNQVEDAWLVPAVEISLEDLGLAFPLPAPVYVAPANP